MPKKAKEVVRVYCEKFDSYFHPKTHKWMERKCDCGDCPFPERPDVHPKDCKCQD